MRRTVSLIAAAVSVVLGISGALRPDERRAPAWADRVAAVADAPIPAGSRVGLVAPSGLGEGDRERLLFELAWQRPDLLWSGRIDAESAALLAFGPTDTPRGWQLEWSRGEVAVLKRAGP